MLNASCFFLQVPVLLTPVTVSVHDDLTKTHSCLATSKFKKSSNKAKLKKKKKVNEHAGR